MTAELSLVVLAVAVLAAGAFWWARSRRTDRQGSPPAPDAPHLGTHILVGIGRPRSAAGLARLAAAIARPENGQVTVLSVLQPETDEATRDGVDATLGQTEAAAREMGTEVRGEVRVDASVADGILHASVQMGASLIVVGWPGAGGEEGALGAPVDKILRDAPCPVLIARLDADTWSRAVLHAASPSGRVGADSHSQASGRLAVEALCRIAQVQDIPALATAPVEVAARWGASVRVDLTHVPDVDGPLGVPDELTIVPVPPDQAAVAGTVRRARPVGDLLLALSHGVEVERRRALLPSAQELLDSSESPAAGGPPPAAETGELEGGAG